jgi:hypothetical protein
MMNDLFDFSRKPEDIFVYIPLTLNRDYLVEIINRHLGEQNQILHVKTENVCADMFGGVACSGATVISMQVKLSNGKTLNLAAKILSPDPVNLFKIDCRFDSRIVEIRWTDWWGRRGKPWSPNVYDTVLNLIQREFWIIREFYPQIGWPDVPESEWGRFSLDADRLRLLVETVAEMHAESAMNIMELQRLFPEPGIRQVVYVSSLI